MCVQVTKTANRFEISSLLEKILLTQVRWCLTFVGLYINNLYNSLLGGFLSRALLSGGFCPRPKISISSIFTCLYARLCGKAIPFIG